jgi:hypothetical protein
MGYFLISFVLSMYPGWQPVPVCDPVIVERRRLILRRMRQARGEDDEDDDEDEDGDVDDDRGEVVVQPADGHLHQD